MFLVACFLVDCALLIIKSPSARWDFWQICVNLKMFDFIYLLTLSLEMPIEASGQISNLNDYSCLFVTGREMSLIKSIFVF